MKRWIVVYVALTILVGCGDNELGLDKRRPNGPPETTLSSGPPDSTDQALYKVQLFWSGTDRDGTVDHFDFIMIDHPSIASHIDGDPSVDDPTRVAVTVPAPDDPRWTGTTSTDSTFVTLADTLRRDPRPGNDETPDDVRRERYERWHTFFVRAVDNEGDVDPTPDYRSFNSRNVAPLVWLTSPIKAGVEFEGPPVIVFNWDGTDDVGDGTFKEPVASRHVIITSPINIQARYKYTNFPDSLYKLPVGAKWSPWNRWDALDGSGQRAIVRGLALQGEFAGSGFYLFAVQALDEAGAVTPVFDWASNGKNNVAWIRVNGSVGPIMTVKEEFLGTQTFVGGSRPVKLDIAAGQPLNFQWSADASRYGGEIVAFRYGWNIRDPNDDQQWDQNWSASVRRSATRSFSTGSQRFFLQVRDNAETITSAVYELTVYTVTRSRDLLWVDDSDFQTATGSENREDARWIEVFHELADKWGFLFDETRDIFDVTENRGKEPPIQKVFDYKSVVWANRSGGNQTSALRNLALFFDPIPRRNQNAAKSFNFLNIYLANRGSMWISGFRPAKQLWPTERASGQGNLAVNVTNWDDPLEPHPFIDSVGTISLLYKMGIEMFDVGSALDSPRNRLQFFCQGFVTAEPSTQTTESTLQLAHTHLVDIPGEHANAPLADLIDRQYATNETLDHSHTVTVTRDDFVAMRNGLIVSVETSESGDEPVLELHTHTFVLVDQSGLWGAPQLRNGPDWAQPPSPRGRTNIEIYNMPIWLTSQPSPLNPRPGISTAPYLYVTESSVREDPARAFFYPQTGDRQPTLILAKGTPQQQFYTRAFCGFEPYLLDRGSHLDLTEYIVVRHFRLGYFDR